MSLCHGYDIVTILLVVTVLPIPDSIGTVTVLIRIRVTKSNKVYYNESPDGLMAQINKYIPYSPSIFSYDEARLNRHFLPWKILKYSERLKMTKYLSRACSAWVKDGQLKAPVYNVIKVGGFHMYCLCIVELALKGPHYRGQHIRQHRYKIQVLYLKNHKMYLQYKEKVSFAFFCICDTQSMDLRARYRAKNWSRSRIDRTYISIQHNLAHF